MTEKVKCSLRMTKAKGSLRMTGNRMRPPRDQALVMTERKPANVGTGLQTCPKRTDLKVYPYDLERKVMCHQCTERVQVVCRKRLKII
jgi:hypothetical protein